MHFKHLEHHMHRVSRQGAHLVLKKKNAMKPLDSYGLGENNTKTISGVPRWLNQSRSDS